jgi:WhiB family redox-sensing transcriptional regulator
VPRDLPLLTPAEVRELNATAEWKERGACYGLNDDQMFPEKAREQREAAGLCQLVCEVQTTCLQYALDADERWGVWGGTTERERERHRKRGRR